MTHTVDQLLKEGGTDGGDVTKGVIGDNGGGVEKDVFGNGEDGGCERSGDGL